MSDAWPIEQIPDEHLLYMRVHRNRIQNGQPDAGVFQNHGEGENAGMSTDWSHYSKPQETITRKLAVTPDWRGGVIQMVVSVVRKIPKQIVEHAPLPENRAHTNVKGPKKGGIEGTRIRYLFMRSWEWAIEFKGTGTVPSPQLLPKPDRKAHGGP
jgi:hypothetical protein